MIECTVPESLVLLYFKYLPKATVSTETEKGHFIKRYLFDLSYVYAICCTQSIFLSSSNGISSLQEAVGIINFLIDSDLKNDCTVSVIMRSDRQETCWMGGIRENGKLGLYVMVKIVNS